MAKILVVDDSEDILEMLGMLLHYKGHEIITSIDSVTTIKAINSFSPDLIILDVWLNGNPKGSTGRELCKDIKKFYPSLPIILMSANPELLKEFEECGADAIIEKPFDIAVLNHTVDALLTPVEK